MAAFFAAIVVVSAGWAQSPPTAPQGKLSEAQLQKLNGLVAGQGRDIPVSPLITEIIGLTKDNQTITCRAFAAAGEGNEVHQIYQLPNATGYLAAHFYKDRLDVYWTDEHFRLLAAVNGIRGQKPVQAAFADAQYGFVFELAWWAKYADAQ
jgi:hypothetical protein